MHPETPGGRSGILRAPSWPDDLARRVVFTGLGLFLGVARVSHFVATEAFRAPVPPWMPGRTS